MNPYVNEEVMWQRLQDGQREAEYRRRFGPSPSFALDFGDAGLVFGRMVQSLFGRFGRRRAAPQPVDEGEAAAMDAA